MDRRLNGAKGFFARAAKGGVLWALPFCMLLLLAAASGLRAADANASNENDVGISPTPVPAFSGSLDAGTTLFYTQSPVLDSLAASAGFPKTGGLWLLWGGGATLDPGPMIVQVSGWEGSLGASSQGACTSWNLGLGEVELAQAYPVGSFLFTLGMDLETGVLNGSFRRGALLTAAESALFGYGVRGGVRWPAQSIASFYVGAGWDMLTGPAVWHGAAGGDLGSTLFELGGPDATVQLKLRL